MATTTLFLVSIVYLVFLCYPLEAKEVYLTILWKSENSTLAKKDCVMAKELSHVDHDLTNLNSLRKSLVRQEDTIIFSLIERARLPMNPPLYHDHLGNSDSSASLFDFFVKESEALQAKAGRYISEEENAFFPKDLPSPVLPHKSKQILHPPGASININDKILNLYIETLLPLISSKGDDDGNNAVTAAADLTCLQALSRRIHYGKFVAEVKFRDSPDDYIPAIKAKDKEALMKQLTFPTVEELIIKRVAKKAKLFGQDVDFNQSENNKGDDHYKVDPSVVSRLYRDWVIPLTKYVQVEYLLRRLD